jgi:hypothetical protein
MFAVRRIALPPDALLQSRRAAGAFTDCYVLRIDRGVTLGDCIAAFFTTPVFRLERWIIARVLGKGSTDAEARALGDGRSDRFLVWVTEARRDDQILLGVGRTATWLMVELETAATPASAATLLYLGSAIERRPADRGGWKHRALLRFHDLYSRVLLQATARRLARRADGD